jgi:CHASE3 domain sensor protein
MQKSRSLVFIAAGISVVVLIAAGVASYTAVKTLSDASDRLVRSQEISIALEQTLSSLRDAETGQRGYLLTGRQAYLEPYAAAVASVNQRLARLRSLGDVDLFAQHSLQELEQSARAKMDELARTIALREGGRPQAALQVVLTDEGKLSMDRIRQITELMQGQEAMHYKEYLDRERSARTLSLWSGGTVSVLAIALRLQGHQVEVVHDGAEALRRLAQLRPQFALIDIGMPNVNGYEVARRARAEPWGASIGLIALTGWGQEQDRQEALDAGFDHHLVKPVDTAVLMQLLVE